MPSSEPKTIPKTPLEIAVYAVERLGSLALVAFILVFNSYSTDKRISELVESMTDLKTSQVELVNAIKQQNTLFSQRK